MCHRIGYVWNDHPSIVELKIEDNSIQFVAATSFTVVVSSTRSNQLIHCRELISSFSHMSNSSSTAVEQRSQRNLEFHSFQEAFEASSLMVEFRPKRLSKYSWSTLTQHFSHFDRCPRSTKREQMFEFWALIDCETWCATEKWNKIYEKFVICSTSPLFIVCCSCLPNITNNRIASSHEEKQSSVQFPIRNEQKTKKYNSFLVHRKRRLTGRRKTKRASSQMLWT